MEKVLTNDMSRLLIILGIGVIGLSALTSKLIAKARGSFKPYRKATLLYLLCFLLFFALIAIAAHPSIYTRPLTFFIFYQAYFLLLGIVHAYTMRSYLAWSGSRQSFWPELLFTIIVSLFGSIGFMLLYRIVNPNGLEMIMATSVCFFIVPFFFYHTFTSAVSIPPKIIRQWYYPVTGQVEEPDESKMKNLLVISFEFQKHTGDVHYTNFRAKAPTDMEFGLLFYYFINDYNERHESSKIQFINAGGEPHGWIFYKKPRWYSVFTEYIDTEKTIYINDIRENDVIICSRSLN